MTPKAAPAVVGWYWLLENSYIEPKSALPLPFSGIGSILWSDSCHPNMYFLFQNSHLERPDTHAENNIRIPLWDLSSEPRLALFHPL